MPPPAKCEAPDKTKFDLNSEGFDGTNIGTADKGLGASREGSL